MRLLAAALSAIAAISPLTANASDAPIPDRRPVSLANVDFYGGDLRSIFDTSLDACAQSCMANPKCLAFTFNTRASACFLKDDYERTEAFEGAISANILDADPTAKARAAQRAADIDFMARRELDAASRFAIETGLQNPVNAGGQSDSENAAAQAEAAGDLRLAAEYRASATTRDDDSAAWSRYAATLIRIETDDYQERYELREQALSAATNAVLRSANRAERASSLGVLARVLTRNDRGRDAVRALRLANEISPSAETAASLLEARKKHGFRVVEHSVDSDAARPRICVTFSEAVAAETTDFEPFVRVTGKDLPVEAEDRQVCVTGVEHGERYRVTLRAGLPAADPYEKLLQPVTLDIYVRDRAPSVRFASRAYVLPRSVEAAIPVTTVNLEEVELALHRIGDRNLVAAIQDNLFQGSLDRYRENNIADRLGETVWTGVGEVETDLNADVTTRLPIGDAVASFDPGVYALTARVPGDTNDWQDAATQWFVVTDLGLTTTLGADGLHVFVRGLSDAGAVAGAKLILLASNNSVLGEAVSDENGYAAFPAGLTRGSGGRAPALLTAQRGDDDFAFLDLSTPGFDLTDRGVDGRAAPGPVDVFATTERGAYRPGETVHLTALARDGDARAVAELPLTVVVERPDGVEYLRKVVDDTGAGGRALSFALDGAAMRGNWRLALHADPKTPPLAETTFLVEDFLPERIDVALSAEDAAVPATGTLRVDLRAEYLYGAPAGGLAIEGEAVVSLAEGIDAFPGYRFGRTGERFDARAAPLGPGLMTAPDGAAQVPLPLPQGLESTQPLQVEAIIRVRDSGGRPVERRLARAVLADAPRIGVKPLFDGAVGTGLDASFEAIAIAPDDTRIALEGVTWHLSKVNTRYQWYRLDGRWDYEPVTTRERVASGTLEIGADAPASLELPVEWGRYELTMIGADQAKTVTSIAFTAGWYAPVAGSGTPDTLQISTDAERYAVGETAQLRIEARHPGQALIQIVDDGLIAMKAVEVTAGENTIPLDVTEDWGPGAYIVASLLRPMDMAAGRNPGRALGVAWTPVDVGTRRLDVAFSGADEASPRTVLDASVEIAGLAKGERAYVTVAAVDLGVLNITGYETPRPEEWYFGQRRLGVELRDLYGRLIDGMSGARGRIRSGGGAQIGSAAPPPVEDIVARFSGVVTADADGVADVRFELPDFNGTVRLMAMAWTDEGVGSAEKDVLVRDPVVLTASSPRFLAPGDESRLLLDLAHAFGPAGDIGISLTSDAQVELGKSSATLALDEGGQARIAIPVVALSVGDPEVVITVTTPDGAELAKSIRLPVRANDPEIVRRSAVPLVADGSFTLDAASYDGLVAGTGRASLVLGPLANFDAAGILNQLDLYPYGCTEQLTSRALPLLYYGEVAETLGLAPSGGGVRNRVGDAIRRVLANQTASGSFGLWRPSGGDFWLDAYVTDFLSRARAAGHVVPVAAFEAALDNLRNRIAYAGDFERGGEDIAYALMVLARESAASIGDLRYFADTKAGAFATPMAQAQLGAALALYGEPTRADKLFRLANASALLPSRSGRWRSDYGTSLRDAAAVLALSSEAGSEAVNREALTRLIATKADDERRYTSTQEKVWTLLAARALLDETASAAITVNGTPSDTAVLRFSEKDLTSGDTVIRNDGRDLLAGILTTIGVPSQPEPSGGNGYAIERAYFTIEGETADPEEVDQNTRLVVVLRVTDERGERARLMVDDALPAGFEIDNPSLLRAGDIAALDWLGETVPADYTAFQTDRFLAAIDARGEDFRLAYLVRAISPGSFHHPAALVEDMYRPEFRARTATGRVRIAEAD